MTINPYFFRCSKLLLLTFATTLLFLADDYLLRALGVPARAELELEYTLALWGVNLCLWLSGRRWLANLCLILFSIMQLLQLAKITYSGTPLAPYDIANLIQNQADVSAVFWNELPSRWPAILAWLLPYGSLFYLFNHWLPHYQKRWQSNVSWLAVAVVVYALLSRPLSALDHRMVDFMPGVTRSSLHNSLNAFSYYVTKMAFQQASIERPIFLPYQVTPLANASKPGTIMLIIPDSLRFDRLSIAGYARNTTPFLNDLKQQGKLQVIEGIAGSIATGASLPLLLNAVREPGNIRDITEHTANLFRWAKQAGYRTFWLSSEESKMINNLGVNYIDHIITREDFMFDLIQQGDAALVEQLDHLPLGERNLIVMLIRSVHAPYAEAYQRAPNPQLYERWPTQEVNTANRQNNAYDNAVYYLDQAILEPLLQWGKQHAQHGLLWMLTSDHGQELGTNGEWGHNILTPGVANVPIVLYQQPAQNQAPIQLPTKLRLSHYELAKWLLTQIGYRLDNPNEQSEHYYQQGFNIFGDNNYRLIIDTPQGLVFCPPTFISDFQHSGNCQKPAKPSISTITQPS